MHKLHAGTFLAQLTSSNQEGSDKAPFRTEQTEITLRAKGKHAEAHIQALVDIAREIPVRHVP